MLSLLYNGQGEVDMEWNDEKQTRLDALRVAELAGSLNEADEAELTALIEYLETEEQERLSLALAQMQAEQAALRQYVQESESANEQLLMLTDSRRLLLDLQSRHRAVREAYQRVTGEPLSVGRGQ